MFILESGRCQKQIRSHVHATNLKLHYLNSTPQGLCSLRSTYARLSLACCGNKNNCLLGFYSPQRGSVCDNVMSISTLKLGRLPVYYLGGLLKGEDTSREICLICSSGSSSVSVTGRSRGRVFSQRLRNAQLLTSARGKKGEQSKHNHSCHGLTTFFKNNELSTYICTFIGRFHLVWSTSMISFIAMSLIKTTLSIPVRMYYFEYKILGGLHL